MMYAQDYDEVLPYASRFGTADTPPTWDVALQPYVKNTQLFVCPSNPTARGYGWNYQNFGYFSGTSGYSGTCGRALAVVAQPAETIIIGDNPDTGMWGAGWEYIYGPTQAQPPADGIGNVSGRHNDGANYGFLDGHAKWLSRSNAASEDRLWTVAAD